METPQTKAEVHVPTDAYSSFCNGTLEEPYPLLHELQDHDPVHWSPELNVWVITRYDDVLMGLSDQRFANNHAQMNLAPISPDSAPHLSTSSPASIQLARVHRPSEAHAHAPNGCHHN